MLSMVEVYQAFASLFKLKFKGVRSLQAIPNEDEDQKMFKSIFARFVSESNEVLNYDESHPYTDLWKTFNTWQQDWQRLKKP